MDMTGEKVASVECLLISLEDIDKDAFMEVCIELVKTRDWNLVGAVHEILYLAVDKMFPKTEK